MIILEKRYTIKELNDINSFINRFVKGVVDLNQELVALDADMHYELADYLKEQRGSKESASFINIHNNQIHGFPRRGMGILDSDIMQKATEVI